MIEIIEKGIALISSIVSLAASIIAYRAIRRGKKTLPSKRGILIISQSANYGNTNYKFAYQYSSAVHRHCSLQVIERSVTCLV